MGSPLLQTPVNVTYSFKDLVGKLQNPAIGTGFTIVGGNIGNGTITIRMLTDRTEMETAADGTVMPTYIPGQSAEITIEMQQTSALHHALVSLFNTLATAANDGDISNWAGTVLNLRTVLDGSGHLASGVGLRKIADKTYASKGQNVTWSFMCASCVQQ